MRRRDRDLVHIDADRYRELKYFCYQYHRWKDELREINESLGPPGSNNDGLPYGRSAASATEQKAIRLYMLQRKIYCVDTAAKMASTELAEYILFYCTHKNISFLDLEAKGISCSRPTFDRHRAIFFRYLSMLLDGE